MALGFKCRYSVLSLSTRRCRLPFCSWIRGKIKSTNSPLMCFDIRAYMAALVWAFLSCLVNVCVCVCVGLCEPTYVRVGDFGCASPAPNHLSQRGHRLSEPIISVQQLLGSSLCFPTMARPRQNAHSHTGNDNVCLALLSAAEHTSLTITQTLVPKTVNALFPLLEKTGAFHRNFQVSRSLGGSEAL